MTLCKLRGQRSFVSFTTCLYILWKQRRVFKGLQWIKQSWWQYSLAAAPTVVEKAASVLLNTLVLWSHVLPPWVFSGDSLNCAKSLVLPWTDWVTASSSKSIHVKGCSTSTMTMCQCQGAFPVLSLSTIVAFSPMYEGAWTSTGVG